MSDETVMAEEPRRSGWLLAAIVIVLLLLCCCGVLALGWFFGDTLVAQLGSLLP